MLKKLNKPLSILSLSLFTAGFASAAHSNKTADLWYFPATGTFVSTSALGYTSKELKADGGGKLTESTLKFAQSITYAPMDKLSFGLTAAYASVKQKATGGSSDTNSGLTDPDLYVSYRILDQDADQWNLDSKLTISPSIGKNKDNNVLRGSSSVGVEFKAGQKVEDMAFGFGLDAVYFTDAKSESGDTKTKFDFAVFGDYQQEFNDMWAGYAKLAVLVPGDDKAKTGTAFLKQGVSFQLDVGPKVSFSDTLNLNVLGAIGYGPSSKVNDGTGEAKAKTWLYAVNASLVAAF